MSLCAYPSAPVSSTCTIKHSITTQPTPGDKDPKNLVGTVVKVPNNLWAGYENDKNGTSCTIVGYSATTRVPNSKKIGAYVVEADEEHFALDAAYHVFNKKSNKKK